MKRPLFFFFTPPPLTLCLPSAERSATEAQSGSARRAKWPEISGEGDARPRPL